MMEQEIVEIPLEFLEELKDMYRIDWPKHINGCYTIDTFIKWFKKNPKLEANIFGLNDSWKVDGTFVILEGFYVYLNTLQDSCENLKKLLKLIDIPKDYTIGCFSERLRPAVLKVVEEKYKDVEFDSCTYSFYLPKEEALKLPKKLTDGISLKPLKKENSLQIINAWPYNRKGAHEFLKRLIDYDTHLGAFDSQGNLVGWCLRLSMGSLGFLQVEEDHMGKGYGTMIAIETTRLFASLGYDVTSKIYTTNAKSIKLFEKLGFKRFDSDYWILPGNKKT